MNSYSKQVENTIMQFEIGKLIVASLLHLEQLSNIPALAFYKSLERLVTRGELLRVSKGIYSRPKKTRFGSIGSSEEEIINHYTNNKNGVIVGYRLFNNIGLTTQVPKKTKIYSTQIKENQKKIGNISISRLNVKLEESAIKQIEALEVLENYQKIEDINYSSFVAYTKKIAKQYNEKAFGKVILNMNYKKRTIAFLQMILNHYNVRNTLSKYLSSTSNYKIPNEGVLYEVTS